MNSYDTTTTPWMYFLAGALLPTLAWYYFQPVVVEVVNDHPSDHERNEDSSSSFDDDDASEQEDITPHDTTTTTSSSWGMSHAPYKMVFVVNTELKMGKGKMAAQCGHAAVGCYQRMIRQCPKAVSAWQHTGCAKIAVQCPNAEELEHIRDLVRSNGIPYYLVEDAGRTQIAAGSRTVLGVFGPTSVFTGVTDHLKLL